MENKLIDDLPIYNKQEKNQIISEFFNDICHDILTDDKFKILRNRIIDTIRRDIKQINMFTLFNDINGVVIHNHINISNICDFSYLEIPYPLNINDFYGIDLCYFCDKDNSKNYNFNNLIFEFTSNKIKLGYSNPELILKVLDNKEINLLKNIYCDETHFEQKKCDCLNCFQIKQNKKVCIIV
jgi:hypothetical protein